MVPNQRECIVHLIMMEQVIGPLRSVVKRRGLRNPIDRKGYSISCSEVIVEPPVILDIFIVGWANGRIVGDIGNIRKPAPHPRTRVAGVRCILRSQTSSQWGTDIQSLARNRSAIHSFNQANVCTCLRNDGRRRYSRLTFRRSRRQYSVNFLSSLPTGRPVLERQVGQAS